MYKANRLDPGNKFQHHNLLAKNTKKGESAKSIHVYYIYTHIYGAQSGPTSQPWPLCFGLFRFVLEAVKHHLVT